MNLNDTELKALDGVLESLIAFFDGLQSISETEGVTTLTVPTELATGAVATLKEWEASHAKETDHG